MTLRLLHTSDWHLGRSLHEESLLGDQAWVLDRLLEAIRTTRPDVLVVSGDVYDRAVPSADAVELLDDTLHRIAGLNVPVVAIAGNHDSAERLSFGSRLLERSGVHLRGGLDRIGSPVEIAGKGFIYPLPFVDPEVVRGRTGDESLRGHAAAVGHVVAEARAHAERRTLPAVLVGHAYVLGAVETPDSERPIAVGSAGAVPVESFRGFDYVALGHLHAPQEVSAGVRYSGSLLKYSFAEAEQSKAVLLAEVDRDGPARIEHVPLGQRRDVARLRGTLAELLARPELERHRADLLEVTLDDEGYVLDARNRLQQRFPHVLNVLRRQLQPGGEGAFAARVGRAGGDDLALFKAFMETVSGGPPSPEELACFASTAFEVARKGGEP